MFSTFLALFSGQEIIIADRYLYTIGIYLRFKGIKNKLIFRLLHRLPRPELLFFLEIDADSALQRITSRGKKPEKYETKELLEAFASGYDAEFKDVDFRCYTIDALDTVERIHEQILQISYATLLDTTNRPS